MREMATTSMSGELAAARNPATSTKPAASLLSLPTETQREIVAHGDLICLALVSRHFHELASAQLYRNFHIIFPDDDDPSFDSPIDGLAGGLETFTTSEHNYARYLKDLSMDTLSTGRQGELSYEPYLYTASCGKFLNTLLHLTLKRARSLESFRWNIRVELSRPVYAQLHDIRTLKTLHIRLQVGDSYYNPPPPLPTAADPLPDSPSSQPMPSYGVSAPSSSAPHTSNLPLGTPLSLLPHSSRPRPTGRTGNIGVRNAYPPTLSGFKDLSRLSVLDIDSLDVVQELQACVKNSFSTLKALQLSLSCSLAQRARKSPQDDSDESEDSELEDELQADPHSSNDIDYHGNGPAKAFRVQEERKLQERILARILDVEEHQLVNKSPKHLVSDAVKLDGDENVEATATATATATGSESRATGEARNEFVVAIKTATTRLMTSLNGSRDFSISQQEDLEIIERAARKYVDSDSKLSGASSQVRDSTANEGETSNSGPTEESLEEEATTGSGHGCLPEELPDATSPGLWSSETSGKTGTEKAHVPCRIRSQSSPEDIDIEHLETVQDHLDEFHDRQSAEGAVSCSPSSTPLTPSQDDNQATNLLPDCVDDDDDDDDDDVVDAHDAHDALGENKMNESSADASGPQDRDSEFKIVEVDRDVITAKLAQLHQLVRGVGRQVLDIRDERLSGSRCVLDSALDSELARLNKVAVEVADEIRTLETKIDDLADEPTKRGPRTRPTKQSIEAYKRKTRGLSIESLKMCLIPVRASVLSQAIDVACIKELTLLNVGNQGPVWSMLTKEQKNRPLALRSVYTDHVSASFLACMAQLPVLEELFLLERGPKHKPKSFAPRSGISMDQIRRLVLKKHMRTLKRLMIKDDYFCPTWDADEKTLILVCTQGVRLEELAVSMNVHAVHAFMQYFSGLVNLRAINILHFKSNDTCVWVVRELFRFIVDNLSHNPQLKLEWIATEDDRVDRVIRPCETQSEASSQAPAQRNKDKDKGKAHVWASGVGSPQYPILPTDAIDTDSESDEDDDDDEDVDGGRRLRFKTIGPLQFYDVWGVKIFEKEIRKGVL
ncbi:hypothetical protein E4U42_002847 [Claviceps africana]|uniref:F-box domain-containing protein n=1 Tax=Claviceps africana TaxID=83212 RepID=A0A8K0J883_9HYPO|nr:hypothetical protein E4U42_002847 [Claviceps africana]